MSLHVFEKQHLLPEKMFHLVLPQISGEITVILSVIFLSTPSQTQEKNLFVYTTFSMVKSGYHFL